MKTIILPVFVIISMIASLATFTECSKEVDQEMIAVDKIDLDTVSFPHSMKGWELYSRPNGNGWNYSFLGGTNRLKTYDEVTTSQFTVFGKDSLIMLLDKFPVNEHIFWIGEQWLEDCWHDNYKDLSMPDISTINEIRNYCLQKGLLLNISN